jgi:hypothetical protein
MADSRVSNVERRKADMSKPGYSDDIMVTWEGERFTVSEVEQKIASIYGAE